MPPLPCLTPRPRKASGVRFAVIGSWVMGLPPMASVTDLATAATTGLLLLSLMPLLWKVAGPPAGSDSPVTSCGMSLLVGIFGVCSR